MIEVKRFSGKLNNDVTLFDVLPNEHIGAKNAVFRGGNDGLTAQAVKGNVLISNSNLPTGINECIGSFYDSLNQLIFFFNYNGYGQHGIYKYSIQTGAITQVFRCFVNSATDVLNFSLNNPITSVTIIYRGQGDGDLLYWTDGLNKPRYLNLDTVSALSPFTENMLYVARIPPLTPPSSPSYSSNASENSNRVKNKYFQFAYRWVYANNEKSTLSPWSKVPIPPNVIYPNQDIVTNTNNVISFGATRSQDADSEGVEIVAREWNGAAWGPTYLINEFTNEEFDLIPLSIVGFLNNGVYAPIPPDDSDLYYDHVPLKANALENLNGNVIIYGGITDGYDGLTRSQVDVQVTSTLVEAPSYPAVASAWKWGQRQRLGLQYFDKWGKPIGGVISYIGDSFIDTTNFDVTTPQFAGAFNPTSSRPVPRISISINHIPPTGAESYQILRQDLTPQFFLQYVTNDYQTDADFAYLCIQGLIQANTQDGFLPSYEFTSGDRVRLLGYCTVGAPESIQHYSTQFDVEIIEVVTRTMGSGNPAEDGSFLKIKKITGFSTVTPYLFVEIYTPPSGFTDGTSIFYEFGERYGFQEIDGIKYHLGGTQNQTASQPAITTLDNGDVYLKSRDMYPTLTTNGWHIPAMDRRYNDFQNSAVNSNGRGWLINPDAKQEYNPVLVRWTGEYQHGTNINNLNRFRPTDYDEADRGKGDIRRFKARDRILRVFQDRGVGQWGIYTVFVRKNEGNPDLLTTNEIITVNNVQYYDGTYGLGGYVTNLCSSPIADYFTDIVTGREIRLSGDGITDLGMLYNGQFTFPALVAPYNKEILRSNGSIAKVIKFFDSFDGETHTILQAGTVNGVTIPAYHYSFNEPRNGFCCDDYDYKPEWGISAADIIFTWNQGNMYRHNSSNYCNFYGVQYGVSVTVVFNKEVYLKKSWNSITQNASDIWECPEIISSVNSYGSTKQQTSLVTSEFTVYEGMPSASIKRDANSPGGKINGSFIKGNYLSVKFVKNNASNFVNLTEVAARFTESPLNIVK